MQINEWPLEILQPYWPIIAISQNHRLSKGHRPCQVKWGELWRRQQNGLLIFEQATFTLSTLGVFLSSGDCHQIGSVVKVSVCVLSSLSVRAKLAVTHWRALLVPYSLLDDCPLTSDSDDVHLEGCTRRLQQQQHQQQNCSSCGPRADRLSSGSSLPAPASALTFNYIFISHKWLLVRWPLPATVVCFMLHFEISIFQFDLLSFCQLLSDIIDRQFLCFFPFPSGPLLFLFLLLFPLTSFFQRIVHFVVSS